MELFFKDYLGRKIRISEERVRHIEQHFEMRNFEEHIRETLQKPELVVRSTRDEEASLYYRYYLKTKIGDKWLCIVVKDEKEPFVLTAYFTDKIKKGEVLWTSNT